MIVKAIFYSFSLNAGSYILFSRARTFTVWHQPCDWLLLVHVITSFLTVLRSFCLIGVALHCVLPLPEWRDLHAKKTPHVLIHSSLQFSSGYVVFGNDMNNSAPSTHGISIHTAQQGLSESFKQLIRFHIWLVQSFAHAI
jgi:hypothetical protein